MVGINTFQLLIVFIAPFGGITVIINALRRGFYKTEVFQCFAGLITLNVCHAINQVVAFIYFTSMLLCIGTLALRWIGMQQRYRLGIYIGMIPLIILFLGMMLNLFGC